MKASDLFLKCLEKEGVTAIYGVPGEENADIMISLLNSPIEFITCRHEQTASFMADMHGRLTGRPGVCLATLGPGATNLITGVANADMDHAPLIAIIGQAETNRLHKESHQNMDSVAMYEPTTKWATTVREADVIPEVISKAVKITCRPKPGAVLIELPEDIAKHDTDKKPMHAFQVATRGTGDVNPVLEAIAKAKKPILLVGDGVLHAGCAAELKTFMDKTNIYGTTTFMGKGAIDDRHAHSLHTVGMGMKDIAVEAYDAADLVICVGYSLYEWAPAKWRHSKQTVVHMDYIPAETDSEYEPDVELIGDIKQQFIAINEKLDKKHVKAEGYFAKIRERLETDLHRYDNDMETPVKPQVAIHQLREAMGDDDILISDVGAHKMWVARQYMTYQPKTCFIHNGFCSMGGSMPGAVEAKRLFPKKNVVALCGDGGFMMSIQALSTAVTYKIPIVVMLWEDDKYGLIKWKQDMEFGKESHIDLDNPDLCKLAESFGANSIRIDNTEQLQPALKTAFAEKTVPTVIVVPIDYSENMKLTEHLHKIVK
tara:strand:- start:16357 stop:17985 length:1629 start_codon:yes stop_codon:yes gene_type:complete